VKLVCIGDAKIDYVSLVKLEPDAMDTTECYLESALYPDSTDVADNLRSIDANYADFHYGDRILLTYTAPPGPDSGLVRDFVVVSKGYYTPDTTYGGPQARIVKPPLRLELLAIQPNPTRQGIDIRFQIPEKRPVNLKVYDASGKQVRILFRAKSQKPGVYTISWDGKDNRGRRVPSGVYFIRLNSEKESKLRKVIMLR